MTRVTQSLLAPRYWPTWLGVGLLTIPAWLPWRFRHWLGTQLGKLIYRHNHKRRQIVLTNLRLCFPHWPEEQIAHTARTSINAYACALLDYSLLFFRSRHWLHKRLRIQGSEHIDQAIRNGQNVILLLGHSVWLEFAPVAIGRHYRAYGSYKPFRNPVVNWLIARSRLKDVEFVVAREDGMMKLVRALEPGRLMFFLPDEDHGPEHSVFASFFGVPKATLTTPARLSKLGKAAALPVMAFFNHENGGYEIIIQPPLENYPAKDAAQNAQALNQALTTLINRYPEQYMWILKLFRTRPQDLPPVY